MDPVRLSAVLGSPSRALTTAVAFGLVAGLLAGLPGEAYADTRVVRDRGGPTGPHQILRVRVDNTGPTVEIDVRHARRNWRGRVTLALDTVGNVRADHVATIRHAWRTKARFRNANGTRWRCGRRRMVSGPHARLTRLILPRACLNGAPWIAVRATSKPARGRADRATTARVLQQSRPNVLMFVVDDMRLDDLAYMPNTRRWIGSAGTTWSNSLAPYPLCCPARASIFSGEYSHNHGVFSHLPPYGFHAFHDSSTLATWMHAGGYQTALLGKYLNGYGQQPPPGRTSGVSVHYAPPGWDDWRGSIDGGLAATNPKNGGTYRYWDTTLSENRGRGLVALAGTYQTYAYGRILSQMIPAEAASDRPFFTYAAFTAPHVGQPREPDDPQPVARDDGKLSRMATAARPASLRGRFDGTITKAPGADWLDADPSDKPEELQANPALNDAEKAALLEVTRQRAESLYAVDLEIAKVMQQLRRTGELEETYVIFTSDNGYFLGEQGIREGKVLPYEPSLRTPLLIRGPGIPAGKVRTDPFLSIDFAPTILQMAGLRVPASVDGVGMLPVAQHGDRGWSRPVLVNTGPANVVRDTDESGVPIPPDDPGKADQRYLLGVRTNRYLFTDRADGFQELYDLRSDPQEYVNLIADPAYAHVVAELRTELTAIRACAGATCRRPLPADLRTPPGG